MTGRRGAGEALRLGVVGAGYMGRLHAAKVEALRSRGEAVELRGVADIVPERAAEVVAVHGGRSVADFRELLGECDAMVVAVPTSSHFSVVTEALEAGLDVLVEKPIAADLSEAEGLLDRARASGRVLQVGHLEWFNTAMEVIRKRIREPRFVEVHRLGPFPDRATDVDVVRDLMIHDLDILQQLLGEEPDRIDAVGIPVLTDRVDIANARISFPGGCVANLTASRVSPVPMRKLRFFQADGYFSIDLLEQSAVAYRRERNGPGGAPRIRLEEIEVSPGDALLDQLEAFVATIRRGAPTRVDGNGGLVALRTALRVIDAIPPYDGSG